MDSYGTVGAPEPSSDHCCLWAPLFVRAATVASNGIRSCLRLTEVMSARSPSSLEHPKGKRSGKRSASNPERIYEKSADSSDRLSTNVRKAVRVAASLFTQGRRIGGR